MKRSANGRNDDTGAYVNREPVDAVLLYDGDEIQIGKPTTCRRWCRRNPARRNAKLLA